VSLVASYLTQTVIWERVLGYDEFARPIMDTQQIAARVEPANRLIRNREGAEVVSRARILTRAPVQPGDWLTLPDGARQPVLDARGFVGLGGEEYREVYV